MKRLIFLTVITLLFLSHCAQNVGVKIDPEYDPEVRIIANQDYPELKSSEILQVLEVNEKIYPITMKNGHEVAKIPGKYLKNIKKYQMKSGLNDLWNFTYQSADKIVEAEPKNYSVALSLVRQNPENHENNRPFVRDDLSKVDVFYKDKTLPSTRFLPEHGRPDMLDLKIPSFPEVQMDDYRIKIEIPGYEVYDKKLIDIQDKKVLLKLRQSMLKFKFVNLENSSFEPGFIYLENKYSKVEKYSSSELKSGISIYGVEFPVKIFSKKKSISIFDNKANEIDTMIINKAGYYDLIFKENVREFPAIFYDISDGKTTPEIFEQWLNDKKSSSEGVFVFVSNGDEKISNSNPNNIINVTNQIYRIIPRTSNVLESLEEFTKKFTSFAKDANLNDEEIYGTKLLPRYYIFLSDDNVERLEFAVDKFTRQIKKMDVDSNDVIVYINSSKKNSSIIKQLKNNNFNVQTI